MTEQDWLRSTDPTPMLDFLQESGLLSERKARLFAVACCRRAWSFLTHIRSREAVEAAERFADGLISRRQLELAAARAGDVSLCASAKFAARLARVRLDGTVQEAVQRVSPAVGVSLLQDLFNPFRAATSINNFVLGWNDGTVRKIAQGICDDGAFDRLPILADALQDAGCDNEEILRHCREHREHARGCWLVDLLTGRE